MANSELITGGCACRNIRYEYPGEQILSVNCHCSNCQRASGTGYAAIIVVWKDQFEITNGEVSYYIREPEDGDYLRRGFCAACGSPVSMLRQTRPKLAYILAGSLDSPERYQPSMNIFTDEAHSWDAMDGSLETFVGMPPVPDDLGR